ncbi:hypothetical protein TOPH_00085 [Tolypocladium ophioglossoides CBS 100239]|uniref:G-protein coupled receptors family 2 profile 2 domain-containing protein n=1 Tax=Tolypocladium ophioglossoides (strain CBS 100239) TaxID=1163406 RepID=A0A0L0NKY1_TOLOC|nr:hypothetical protein TOPH_00085 [Tolypocladium ophioglossoides CBS 100239]
MVNLTGVNLCPPPFWDSKLFSDDGYVDGRLCQTITDDLKCCLPCPMVDWVYPDSFNTVTVVANWVATISAICCLFFRASWAALPVDKTNRHYLSICFVIGIFMMNLGFVIPLAAQPDQCFDKITPHGMHTSKVCGASGTFLLLGGWCGVMWSFLRSFSLHLQICWQVLVGRNFMIFAQAAGWGVPILGIILALVFSGVSFRFGATCHINHRNSLTDLWIPLLIFAGATVILTFVTFGYCIKVYLASLSENSASTEGSSLPTYSNSVRTMTPRQAYRRVKRVIALQWRGLAIVLIIIVDVIFFSIVFVFQDNIVQSVKTDPEVAKNWVTCLIGASGDKNQCLNEARALVVNAATVSAVLLLLALNGIWLIFLLGRFAMITGWIELIRSLVGPQKKEFVSVDARYETKKDPRSYEMLSRGSSSVVTSLSPVKSAPTGRRTPDYFGQTARYHAPARSYSSPRPPQPDGWDPQQTFAQPGRPNGSNMNPLGMNRI